MKPHLNLEQHKNARAVTAPPASTPRQETAPIERLALSVVKAAEASSLSRSTLYMAMGEGHLRFIKVRGRRLILVDDLRAFLGSGGA